MHSIAWQKLVSVIRDRQRHWGSRITFCSEPTDSIMVNVIVAQLPGQPPAGAQGFTAGTCPVWPHLGAATGNTQYVSVWMQTESRSGSMLRLCMVFDSLKSK